MSDFATVRARPGTAKQGSPHVASCAEQAWRRAADQIGDELEALDALTTG